MKKHQFQLTVLLTFTYLTPSAKAAGDGDLWAPFVMNVCMAQDDAYLQTTFAKKISENPQYLAAMREGVMGELIKCIAKKSPMPNDLCNTLLDQTEVPNKLLNLDTLFQKYGDSIQKMAKPMQECTPPGVK